MDKQCRNCGVNWGVEIHHIVFRSQVKPMERCPYNLIDLCAECHRGNKGPHQNRQVDIYYKRQLEIQLKELFKNSLYTEEEVSKILKINIKQTHNLLKILVQVHLDGKYGYKADDIVRVCIGDRSYL